MLKRGERKGPRFRTLKAIKWKTSVKTSKVLIKNKLIIGAWAIKSLLTIHLFSNLGQVYLIESELGFPIAIFFYLHAGAAEMEIKRTAYLSRERNGFNKA